MANRSTTVQQLADDLDADEKYVRSILRKEYPESAPGKGQRWELNAKMRATVKSRVTAMRKRRLARAKSKVNILRERRAARK